MPKGQTSRPFNRKEKQAAKTVQYANAANVSEVNKKTIRGGSRLKDAYSTLVDRDSKEAARKAGAKKEREKGSGLTHRISKGKLVKRK